ncbi:RNA polymerase sigma factor [Dactylosporangium cerinum]|uniref:RNA polymerase sigma factor n=1 Tax=Dactylosporangium cerinum TaxID=1434730 RepID=A0ABV9VQ96_9ACTN
MSAPERRDDELVAAVRAGERGAMRVLATRYLPLVYTVVGRAAEPGLDVDGIVRETMAGLVAGLSTLREPTRLRAWVVTIAMRHLADARRQRLTPGDRLTDPAAAFAGLVLLRQALTREQREVAEATRWLDPSYRDLLSLWWLEVGGHLSRFDVAAAVALPVPHVAVRVQRMREQLDTARRVVGVLRSRPVCDELPALVASWDGQPDPLWSKRIGRHLQGCHGCAERVGGRLVPPERLLAGLPPLVPPAPRASAG